MLNRLQLLNDGLIEKRRQMESAAHQIQREIADISETVAKVSLPEIRSFAKQLETAVHIDRKMKTEQLVYLMNYKVKWSIKEIDGLLWKI